MSELYIGNRNYSSWSLRPWVLLRTLGIPFTERFVPFEPGGSPSFKRFSPSGRVPCLVDGALTVWDSLAITETVAEDHPSVWPQEKGARAWARAAAAEMHSSFGALRSDCSMNCGLRVELKAPGGAPQADLARLESLWLDGLARFGGPYLAGQVFTAVDAFYCPVAFRVQTYGLTLAPAARGYVERLIALPAMQAWYQDALAETYREESHEADIARAGRTVADLRAAAAGPIAAP